MILIDLKKLLIILCDGQTIQMLYNRKPSIIHILINHNFLMKATLLKNQDIQGEAQLTFQ
jgi:hypothetical protein